VKFLVGFILGFFVAKYSSAILDAVENLNESAKNI